jgi:glycine/D-amino acid oxidase-like deaminating enzyme
VTAARRSGFESSLWFATGGPAPSFPVLADAIRTSVTIIGGGFAGTSLALALAEHGVAVTVLEARRIGWGASGRNGGFVVPTLSRLDPDRMTAMLGETGERLARTVGGAADTVFSIIRAHDIDCDHSQSGWHQPAHSAEAWTLLQSRFAQWSGRGFKVALLDSAETARRTGCAFLHGGLFFEAGGAVHPLKLVRGLAQAAGRLGAAIYERSMVRRITAKSGGGWTVESDRGAVASDWVVVCANARTRGLVPRLDGAAAPMRIVQAATRPIPEADRAHLFAKGEALSDTAINLFTYRFDRDWRLITGQLPIYPCQSRRALGDLMARRLQGMLGLRNLPEMEFVWPGTASVTPDYAPKLFELGPRMLATTACNGRGIAISVALGQALGRAIATGDWSAMPVPLSAPNGDGRRLALRAGLPAYPMIGLIRDGRPLIPKPGAGAHPQETRPQ